MPTVADVLRRYGGAYLERFGATMPAEHNKVLRAITACRTGALGTVLYACQSCGRIHAMGRSCGNRHCPTCQQDRTKAWLEKQIDRLLPCPYFLVTFTLPAELRALARSHRRLSRPETHLQCDDCRRRTSGVSEGHRSVTQPRDRRALLVQLGLTQDRVVAPFVEAHQNAVGL